MQAQDRRSYGEVERPSSYLDDTNIGAGTDNLDHDFGVVNFKGKGWGRAEQSQDNVNANPKGEGAEQDEHKQRHDIDVIDSEGEGAGRAEQGKDIIMGRHLEGSRSDMMERHRHWSVSGVTGAGAQRAGAREAAPRYDETRT